MMAVEELLVECENAVDSMCKPSASKAAGTPSFHSCHLLNQSRKSWESCCLMFPKWPKSHWPSFIRVANVAFAPSCFHLSRARPDATFSAFTLALYSATQRIEAETKNAIRA